MTGKKQRQSKRQQTVAATKASDKLSEMYANAEKVKAASKLDKCLADLGVEAATGDKRDALKSIYTAAKICYEKYSRILNTALATAQQNGDVEQADALLTAIQAASQKYEAAVEKYTALLSSEASVHKAAFEKVRNWQDSPRGTQYSADVRSRERDDSTQHSADVRSRDSARSCAQNSTEVRSRNRASSADFRSRERDAINQLPDVPEFEKQRQQADRVYAVNHAQNRSIRTRI